MTGGHVSKSGHHFARLSAPISNIMTVGRVRLRGHVGVRLPGSHFWSGGKVLPGRACCLGKATGLVWEGCLGLAGLSGQPKDRLAGLGYCLAGPGECLAGLGRF